MLKYTKFLFALIISIPFIAQAQPNGYWQQAVDYTIDVDFHDTKNARFSGKETIVYTNNAPEELNQAFFHLYFNAFQPGSMMDVRSRTILGSSCSRLRPILAALGPSWSRLGTILGRPGTILGQSWACAGRVLGHPGAQGA